MNRLQLPHAKLFYMISEMYKKGQINDDEKRILKCKWCLTQKKPSRTTCRSSRSWTSTSAPKTNRTSPATSSI